MGVWSAVIAEKGQDQLERWTERRGAGQHGKANMVAWRMERAPRAGLAGEVDVTRRTAVGALLIGMVLLTGCYTYWDPGPAYDPYYYSFTDTARAAYPQTQHGAQRFMLDVRCLWQYSNNGAILEPNEAYQEMSGDCDDFAVMVAYYLQEYWGYDTFVVLLTSVDPSTPYNHACAFVLESAGVEVHPCENSDNPLLNVGGAVYCPAEMGAMGQPCAWWSWQTWQLITEFGPALGQGHSPYWEWYELAGRSGLSLAAAGCDRGFHRVGSRTGGLLRPTMDGWTALELLRPTPRG